MPYTTAGYCGGVATSSYVTAETCTGSQYLREGNCYDCSIKRHVTSCYIDASGDLYVESCSSGAPYNNWSYHLCLAFGCQYISPSSCTGCFSPKLYDAISDTCVSPGSCPSPRVDDIGAGKCVCPAGQYLNSLFLECRACSTIHASCTTCTFDEPNNEGECTACSSGTPSADGRTCEGATLANCAVVNGGNPAICDTCDPNHHWTGTACEACSTLHANCTACTHGGVCTTCGGGDVTEKNPASTGLCVTPPNNCATLKSTNQALCDICSANYIVSGTTDLCLPCNAITDCTACTFSDLAADDVLCSTCSGVKQPQYDQLTCVDLPANCQTINGADKTVCDLCDSGRRWDSSTCALCSAIDTACLTCLNNGQCQSCSVPKTLTPNNLTCAAPIINCARLDNVTSTKCDLCDSGFGYPTDQASCLACSHASVTGDAECTSCTTTVVPSYDATCTGCNSGFTPIAGICTDTCQTYSASDPTYCETCINGWKMYEGKCYDDCPSGTRENSAGTRCIQSLASGIFADPCANDSYTWCTKRMYRSWVTGVLGTIDGAFAIVVVVHIFSKVFGGAFMGGGNSTAAMFGARSANYGMSSV